MMKILLFQATVEKHHTLHCQKMNCKKQMQQLILIYQLNRAIHSMVHQSYINIAICIILLHEVDGCKKDLKDKPQRHYFKGNLKIFNWHKIIIFSAAFSSSNIALTFARIFNSTNYLWNNKYSYGCFFRGSRFSSATLPLNKEEHFSLLQ